MVWKKRSYLNFDTVSIKTGPILVFLRIHPLTRVSISFRGIVCSRHECCICLLAFFCFKSIEVLSLLDKLQTRIRAQFWITSGNCSIFRSYSWNNLHPLRCNGGVFLHERRPVSSSIFSKRSSAASFPGP